MIELACVLIGGLIGSFAFMTVLRWKTKAPDAKPDYGIPFLPDDTVDIPEPDHKLSTRDTFRLLSDEARAGDEASKLLESLRPSLEDNYWTVVNELADLEVVDPRDKLLVNAGYLQALRTIHRGLQAKQAIGTVAQEKLREMSRRRSPTEM